MNILRTKDATLLAELNFSVQMIHHLINPVLFKAHAIEGVEAFFKSYLESDDVEAYVYRKGNQTLGYIMLACKATENSPMTHANTSLNIDHINVIESAKGQGIGKALVDFSKVIAKSKGIDRITMSYWIGNDQSGEFFEEQGFKAYNVRMAYDVE